MSDADNDDRTQVLSRPRIAAHTAPPGLLRCVDTTVLKGDGGAQIVLEGTLVTIGRGDENDVALNAHGISRRHARLVAADGAWQVEDLGSTNGTRINNSRIEGTRALHDGDTVAFGRVCYKYTLQQRDDSETTGAKNIDLGAGDRTVITRPGAIKAAVAAAAAPGGGGDDTATPRTGPHARAKSGAGDAGSRRKPAPAPASRSSATLWAVVIVVAAAIAAGAAFALGLV